MLGIRVVLDGVLAREECGEADLLGLGCATKAVSVFWLKGFRWRVWD